MIKKLTLINFQIHKRKEFEFHKRFNIIVGSNDHGKSSIIRAINWVFFNQPNGDWMQRINSKGEKEVCTVKIVFEDDTVIIRKKGDGVNQYKVDDDLYENFGYGVPSPVIERLKVFPFITNKEEFNVHISMQDEHPFLVHESGPVKASVLDVLTGNSIIQKSISSFNKDNLKLTNKIAELEGAISSNEQQLEKLPDIDKVEKLLKEAEAIHAKYNEKMELLNVIEKYKYDLGCEQNILKFTRIPNIEDIEKMVMKEEKLKHHIEKMKEYYEELTNLNDSIVKLPDISGLVILVEKLDKLETQLSKLEPLAQDLKTYKQIIVEWQDDIIKLKKKLKKYPKCPTCGKVM